MEISQRYQIEGRKKLKNKYEKDLRAETKTKNKKIENYKKKSEHEINNEIIRQDKKLEALQSTQTKRLESIKTNYDKSIKILKRRFDQELERIKSSFLSSKTKVYGLDKDEFKDRVELKTELRDQKDYIELEVHVPKEQANNLFTSVDKREIKVNLSRNYADKYSNNDETIEYRKNHSVTKDLRVNDILSDKNITKIILEDKTIFKIPKA